MNRAILLLAISLVVFTNFNFVFAEPPSYEIVDLGVLAGNWSMAYDINDAGQVIGVSTSSSGYGHAFIWQTGTMSDLGSGEHRDSFASAVNNNGIIVGAASKQGTWHAYVWQNNSYMDLNQVNGYTSEASGINDRGQVVGYTMVGTPSGGTTSHAFLWKDELMHDLGTLGGNYSEAHGINNLGEIVGNSNLSISGNGHAFIYRNGQMEDIGH